MERSRIIALEEHYLDPELEAYFGGSANPTSRKLADFETIRLAEMDSAGIDVQVLSHAPPGLQRVDAEAAPGIARRVNDRLHARVLANPSRFAAFAALPTTAGGEAAAEELERAVVDLGFRGGLVNGLTDGLFLDDPRFWPLFERAAALEVPLYIHPADPHPDVARAYFGDYARTHPMFLRAAWGFTFETGTQAVRLVLSGVFDAYPGLQLILGHLGEAIPFLMTRIDEALSRDTPMKTFRSTFTRHFHVTTSGFFSDAALRCCIEELGVDRILFSIDWPYASNANGASWIKAMKLSSNDRNDIMCNNALRFLKLDESIFYGPNPISGLR